MSSKISEKRHRLDPCRYRGQIADVFTARILEPKNGLARSGVPALIIELLAEAMRHFACRVPVFTIMPDHLHIVVSGNAVESDALSAMKRFKQRSGFQLHERVDNFQWQKDFYNQLIRDPESFARQVQYIAANPVRAGLVSHWQEYPHTGAIDCRLDEVVLGAAMLIESKQSRGVDEGVGQG